MNNYLKKQEVRKEEKKAEPRKVVAGTCEVCGVEAEVTRCNICQRQICRTCAHKHEGDMVYCPRCHKAMLEERINDFVLWQKIFPSDRDVCPVCDGKGFGEAEMSTALETRHFAKITEPCDCGCGSVYRKEG